MGALWIWLLFLAIVFSPLCPRSWSLLHHHILWWGTTVYTELRVGCMGNKLAIFSLPKSPLIWDTAEFIRKVAVGWCFLSAHTCCYSLFKPAGVFTCSSTHLELKSCLFDSWTLKGKAKLNSCLHGFLEYSPEENKIVIFVFSVLNVLRTINPEEEEGSCFRGNKMRADNTGDKNS